MLKRQVNTFVQASDDTQVSMKRLNSVYKYVLVGQELSEKLRGQRMLRCIFCANEWQGNRHGVTRHFRSVKGCSQVTDEALMDMHYTSGYAFEGKWLERIRKYEELRSAWADERGTDGGQAQARAPSTTPVRAREQGDDVIDVDGDGEGSKARRLAEDMKAVVAPLEDGLADQIFRYVQEHVGYMCEPAHAAAYLLCPMRRSMQYYNGVVTDEDKWLVREAERYILSQTGFDERRKEYRDAVLQLRDFHMRTSTCSWGGERARTAAEMCVGEQETVECGLWWSKDRNWAIYESVQMKKRNKLLFLKVVKLVEIAANTRLLALQSAGGGLVLPWTQDESMLDGEGGLEADAVCEGVDHNIPEEDRDARAQLWRRDACGSQPPPPVEDVFGRWDTTLRLYLRDDSSGDERKEIGEGFRPHGADGSPLAEGGDGVWSDPEEVRRRSGGRDLFEDTARGRTGVEGCWDESGSPRA
ncbi:hypothetical protein CBR_g50258 [Chara braunii]|uniref:Uncharacterized protein n=1 Tax=Chara braunii TaxID=69332 RepID=A0A388M6F1_CHABU|nr:hypothetical protein CBR_g50258 [Chara braunii]|eukprot:GBG90164.1 hypothetical protein CBR_g50258 [Chara braunii]